MSLGLCLSGNDARSSLWVPGDVSVLWAHPHARNHEKVRLGSMRPFIHLQRRLKNRSECSFQSVQSTTAHSWETQVSEAWPLPTSARAGRAINQGFINPRGRLDTASRETPKSGEMQGLPRIPTLCATVILRSACRPGGEARSLCWEGSCFSQRKPTSTCRLRLWRTRQP